MHVVDKEIQNEHFFNMVALTCFVKALQAFEYYKSLNFKDLPICRLISLILGEEVEEHLGMRHAEKIPSFLNRYCARVCSLTHGILKSERNSKFDGIIAFLLNVAVKR